MPRLHLNAPPGLFRLALALAVFVHHLSRLAIGPAAVYVFFILSGYWISEMWRTKYRRVQAPYITFIISRLWRVLPVFLVCQAFSWLLLYARHEVMPSPDHLSHQLLSNTLIFGYHSLSVRSNGPAWSLDIEAQFYLLAPLVIASLARSLRFSLAYAAAAAFAVWVGDAVSVVPYMLFFVIGIAASLGCWRPSSSLAVTSLGAAGLALAGLVAGPWRDVVLIGTHVGPNNVFNPLACTLLALIIAPFAIYTTSQRSSHIDRLFADLSFIIYLLHVPVFDLIHVGEGSLSARLAAAVEASALIVAGSLAMHSLVDRPMNRWRARWVDSRVAGHSPIPQPDRRPPIGIARA